MSRSAPGRSEWRSSSSAFLQHAIAAGGLVLAGCAGGAAWQRLPDGKPIPEQSRVFDSRFATVADSAMNHLRAARERLAAPALSAAVSVEGTVVWAGVVGWSDLQSRRAATVETEFRLGSTSKAITATALARLVDAGRIALDSPLVRYRPDLPNRSWASLTPRQLASHTAGIPDYAKNRDLMGLWRSVRENRRFTSAQDALDVFDGSGLIAKPGERFLYSSYDVNLLGALIEWITQRPYPQAMDSLVFGPLGTRGIHAQHAADSSRQATFYERGEDGWRPWRPVDHSYKWPSGGLVAAPFDVVRIGGAWFDSTFVRTSSQREFWTPQRLTSGVVNEQSYALGWRSHLSSALWGPERRVPVVHHGGVSKGAFSWLILYPDDRVAIALAMNARAVTFQAFMAEEPSLARHFITSLRSDTVRR